MQCISPLIRAETNYQYINKKGGISYKTVFLPRSTWDYWQKHPDIMEHEIERREFRKVEPVGCGQCTPCKLNYSRDRATLIMMEKIYHENTASWFITLTYDDEHIPFHGYRDKKTGKEYYGASLYLRDTQKFFKKLRFHHPDWNIKYVLAAEYGSKTMRPHYHFIGFEIHLDITKLELWTRNEWGQPVWRCKELEEIWKKGNVMIGEVTWETCAYTCRYVLKKADNSRPKEWYYLQGLHPEWIAWSNGIGDQYLFDHTREILESDCVPVKNKRTGQLVKPPLKFYRTLGDLYPEIHEIIKEKRISEGYAHQNSLITDMPAEAYRQLLNEKIKSQFKDIRRTI